MTDYDANQEMDSTELQDSDELQRLLSESEKEQE